MRFLKTVLFGSAAALFLVIGGCAVEERARIGTPATVVEKTPPPATIVQQTPPVVIEKSSPVIVERTVQPPPPTVTTFERTESTTTDDSFGPHDSSYFEKKSYQSNFGY